MGEAKNNGRLKESGDRLKQSMAALNQAMATFLVRCADTDARIAGIDAARVEAEQSLAAARAESNRIYAALDQRFARIEAILLENSRILRALPDAICEKILPILVTNGMASNQPI